MSTPIRSTDEVFRYLIDQHAKIEALFDDVLGSPEDARARPFAALRRLLAVHEVTEQSVVHPRARRDLDTGVAMIDQRLAEEHKTEQILTELEDLDTGSVEFENRITQLKAAVMVHARREEDGEFDRLREMLTDRELERIANSVRLADTVAPTAEHAAPKHSQDWILVGSFTAMLAQARDEIDQR